jgi:pimeloyl-ACP methyl ester carboxylesterase
LSGKRAEAVLLLHGLWMGGWVMGWLAHELKAGGFDTHALSYRSMAGAPEEHVARLAEAVAQIPADKVHLLGHSMGGVIALRYLLGGTHSRLGRTMLLGVPALGSKAALVFERQPWGRALLGESLALWEAPFPEAIDQRHEAGAIAGSDHFGLGALFVDLPAPNDGVVMIEETRIPGLRDHLVLPVSHTGMLVSSEVARQALAFLCKGAFER